jgi:hypothetical protein
MVLAPVGWRRIEAHLHMIVGAVIGALELGDRRPPGDGACRLHGEHHGLGPGVDEAELLEARCPAADFLGQRRFAGHRQAERRAAIDRVVQRCHHRRESVAMDQREEIVGAVEDPPAVEIGDPGAVAAHRIRWMRGEVGRRAHAAARRQRLRSLELGAGFRSENLALVVRRRMERGAHVTDPYAEEVARKTCVASTSTARPSSVKATP